MIKDHWNVSTPNVQQRKLKFWNLFLEVSRSLYFQSHHGVFLYHWRQICRGGSKNGSIEKKVYKKLNHFVTQTVVLGKLWFIKS